MSENRTDVTVAHPTFWYIDTDGIHRVGLRGQAIDVNDEDHARGQKYAAFVGSEPSGEVLPGAVEPVEPDSGPASDKVEDVKAWVGSDPAKAQEALTAELEKEEGDQRSTLVDHLQKVLGS